MRVDGDAVVAVQPAVARQGVLGNGADAQHDKLGREAITVDVQGGEPPLVHLEATHGNTQLDVDAVGAMHLLHVRGNLGRDRSREQSRCGFEHGHCLAQGARGGGNLQPDEAAAQHGQRRGRHQQAAQPMRVVGRTQCDDVAQLLLQCR